MKLLGFIVGLGTSLKRLGRRGHLAFDQVLHFWDG